MSIALGILAAVEDAFRSTPGAKRVTRIRLRVGVLSLIDVEALRFALRVASRGTPAEDAEIEVEMAEPRFRCRVCGYEWKPSREETERLTGNPEISTLVHIDPDVLPRFLQCPRCGARDVEVVQGTGVMLHSVDIETGEDEERGVQL
ncbi:hydrogenase maturation nickel metallochaperone HypA [Pyrodictium occultum]|nr:hydrogenase maturation nickel metallochaperone HypA [Pyrodictium occultum]